MSYISKIKMATGAASILLIGSCSSFDENYNVVNAVSFPAGNTIGMESHSCFHSDSIGVSIYEGSGLLTADSITLKLESLVKNPNSLCGAYIYNGTMPAENGKIVPKGDISIIMNPDVDQLNQLKKPCDKYDFSRFKGCAVLAIDDMGGVFCVPKLLKNDSYGSLNGLVQWLNRHGNIHEKRGPHFLKSSSDLPDAETLFDSFVSGYTLNFALTNKVVADVVCSDEDKLSGTGTLDVLYTITPLHAFNDQTSPGDYYYVYGTIQLNSAGMYSGRYSSWHGGVDARICGFYAEEVDIESYIADSDDNVIGSFVSGGTPTPSTTVSSTSYTSGLEWNISGEVTGGIENGSGTGGVSVSGGVSISSMETKDISDTNIELDASNSKAAYKYSFQNLPHYTSIKITDPPSVAVNTATFEYAYIINIPTVEDYSEVTHRIIVDVTKLMYGSCHFYSTEADYAEYDWNLSDMTTSIDSTLTSNYIDIPLPNRIPTGTLSLEHDDSSKGAYLDSVFCTCTACSDTAYNDKYKGKVYLYTTSTYGIDESFTATLPTGTYDIVIYIGGIAYKATGISIARTETTYKKSGSGFTAVTSARNRNVKYFSKQKR